MGLVSTHMYKQFLDYQSAVINTNEMFIKMIENMHSIVDFLKQSFASRGVPTQSIYYEIDKSTTVAKLHILWYMISFTMRHNDKPQALYRDNRSPLFSGRILAINGDISQIEAEEGSDLHSLLEHEVASLFVPADKAEQAIIKIKHIGKREFQISQFDADREFILKVIEIICGGGIYHEETYRRKL